MARQTHRTEIPASTLATQRAGDGAPENADDLTAALDHTLQMLFSCCLTLCRASRDAEHKDELIHSAIENLDSSIRVLRGAAVALV